MRHNGRENVCVLLVCGINVVLGRGVGRHNGTFIDWGVGRREGLRIEIGISRWRFGGCTSSLGKKLDTV